MATEARLPQTSPSELRPRVVIIGGGFGGLAVAQELGGSEIDVTVIDRRNHNLFQPLLYQVATAALSPADISEPIRRTLGRYRNISVVLAAVTGIDTERRLVQTDCAGSIGYDYLVLATGSDYNYFGHEDWRRLAPGLKSVREARQIRQRLLLAFEKAELTQDPEEQRALLTSIVIGGGPTGVEMAGAISEMGRFMVARDFRHISVDKVRVILLEGGPRILSAFPEDLSTYAREALARLGVDVKTGRTVADVRNGEVTVDGDRIRAGTIVWGAGVKASPAAQWLGVEPAAAGRVPVSPMLEVIGVPNVYAIGDTAAAKDEKGELLPALAQVAKQQGIYLGRALRRSILEGKPAAPFRFHDRGNTAVIGHNAAIFDFGRWHLKGRLAWFLWALVHVYLLINFEKRVLVSIQWFWRYVTRQRGARLIDETSDETRTIC